MTKQGKIVLGISGGVDSAVAGLLLQRQGYDVRAIFMQNWDDENDPHCSASQDLSDARAVCDQLGLPLSTVNFSADYQQQVFQHFLDAQARGLTPNPDVLCNQEIKFKCFLEHAMSLGADKIATGHYAQVVRQDDQWQLHKGIDANKDQSYFLCRLNQHQLAHSLFPLGGYEKTDIRALAKEAGFDNADKPDSTGICFIGERKFDAFLKEHMLCQPGPIQTTEGEILGQHQGLMFYTIGQRKGIGIGGLANADEAPWFVVDKDASENTLIVGQGHDHQRLFSASLTALDFHWVAGQPPAETFDCAAKVRYRQADQACQVTVSGEQTAVTFDQPQRAITPGQYIVLYEGVSCLGGGVVS